MHQLLKQRYDGYHFGERMVDVYNPFSLLNAFDSQRIRDYWFASGTPSYLIHLMNHFNECIDQLTGKYYTLDEFVNYKADVEYPLPMIYQSGYLTIKAYERDMGLFLLDFPNNEVKSGFLTMVATNYLQCETALDSWIRQAVFALKKGQLDDFRKMLTSFLASIPYTMRRKDDERERERYFQYTFYLLLRLMSVYTVSLERVQSQGRVDCIVETPQHIYIFEFKLDGSAEEALLQIEEKGYARPYGSDSRNIHKIRVSFSSQTGIIDGWQFCRLMHRTDIYRGKYYAYWNLPFLAVEGKGKIAGFISSDEVILVSFCLLRIHIVTFSRKTGFQQFVVVSCRDGYWGIMGEKSFYDTDILEAYYQDLHNLPENVTYCGWQHQEDDRASYGLEANRINSLLLARVDKIDCTA